MEIQAIEYRFGSSNGHTSSKYETIALKLQARAYFVLFIELIWAKFEIHNNLFISLTMPILFMLDAHCQRSQSFLASKRGMTKVSKNSVSRWKGKSECLPPKDSKEESILQ